MGEFGGECLHLTRAQSLDEQASVYISIIGIGVDKGVSHSKDALLQMYNVSHHHTLLFETNNSIVDFEML